MIYQNVIRKHVNFILNKDSAIGFFCADLSADILVFLSPSCRIFRTPVPDKSCPVAIFDPYLTHIRINMLNCENMFLWLDLLGFIAGLSFKYFYNKFRIFRRVISNIAESRVISRRWEYFPDLSN